MKEMKEIKNIKCALLQEGKPRKFAKFSLYTIQAFFTVDSERIEKWWNVEAESVFEADKWANIMIENEAGSLKGVKKQIIKL